MDNQEQIIEKIRKMMALAERAGTEGEADAAMHKVQELLTKYNLDADQIKKVDEETFIQEYFEYEWNQSWIKHVWHGIAKLYFCKMYYTQNGLKNFHVNVIGKPVNIQTARYVADVVIKTGKTLAKAYAQEAYREFGMNAVSASNGFKKGYAGRIQARCNDMVREATTCKPRGYEDGKEIVVADFYKRNMQAIEVFRTSIGIKLNKGKGMASGDHGHMASGASAADSVSLRANGISGSGRGQSYLLGGG